MTNDGCSSSPAARARRGGSFLPPTPDPPAPDAAFVGLDTGWTFHRVAIPGMEEMEEFAKEFGDRNIEGYFVGSAAVTAGGLVFVGNDNGFLYVLDAEVEGPNAGENDWIKADRTNLGGIISSSPALSTNVDGTGQLWLFITSRKEFTPDEEDYGVLWAFTVHEDTE